MTHSDAEHRDTPPGKGTAAVDDLAVVIALEEWAPAGEGTGEAADDEPYYPL